MIVGKPKVVNSGPKPSGERLQKVGVWEYSNRETTVVVAGESWHSAEVMNSV